MAVPSEDIETLAAFFYPTLPETWDDPVVGPVLRRLLVEAPFVIRAVADVDRSLIFDALQTTPAERVARALGVGGAKLDVLCELDAEAGYDELLGSSEAAPFHGSTLRVLGLRRLIQAKAAAGRAKDQMMLPILLATLEARERGK